MVSGISKRSIDLRRAVAKPATVLLWLVFVFGSLFANGQEPSGTSVLTHFIERYYLDPNPSFQEFGKLPIDNFYRLEVESVPPSWGGDVEESELLTKYPDLGRKMEQGAAYRKEVYDKIFAKIAELRRARGIPDSFADEILSSYLRELNAYRNEVQKMSLLEAQTKAFETTRGKHHYATTSNVSNWRLEHQREYQSIVEKLIDEESRKRKTQDTLPEERFRKWKTRIQNEHQQSLQAKLRAIMFLGHDVSFEMVDGKSLPRDYCDGLARIYDRYFDTANRILKNTALDKEGQTKFVNDLHIEAYAQREALEEIKLRHVGSGLYGNPESDAPYIRRLRFLRDLDWWEQREANTGNSTVTQRIDERIKTIQRWKQETDRGFEKSGIVFGFTGRLLEGMHSQSVAQNFVGSGSQWADDATIFSGGGNSLELHYGGVKEWTELLAKRKKNKVGKVDFTLTSESLFFPTNGLVAIPRPESHLAEVRVSQEGRWLDNHEYQLYETREGYLFAKILTKSDRPVGLKIHYQKVRSSPIDFTQDESKLPSLTEREVRKLSEVALGLKHMGEKVVSEQLFRLIDTATSSGRKILPTDIAGVIEASSLYSFYPAKRDTSPKDDVKSFRPFLDKDGKLCFQCTGASELLELVLKKVLIDHPKWKVGTRSVLTRQRSNDNFRENGRHRIVVLQKSGVWPVKVALDPTPFERDPRASNAKSGTEPLVLRSENPLNHGMPARRAAIRSTISPRFLSRDGKGQPIETWAKGSQSQSMISVMLNWLRSRSPRGNRFAGPLDPNVLSASEVSPLSGVRIATADDGNSPSLHEDPGGLEPSGAAVTQAEGRKTIGEPLQKPSSSHGGIASGDTPTIWSSGKAHWRRIATLGAITLGAGIYLHDLSLLRELIPRNEYVQSTDDVVARKKDSVYERLPLFAGALAVTGLAAAAIYYRFRGRWGETPDTPVPSIPSPALENATPETPTKVEEPLGQELANVSSTPQTVGEGNVTPEAPMTKAIRDELKKRQERNSARRSQLERVNHLRQSVLQAVKTLFRRPVGRHMRLPHQIALQTLKDVTEFMQNSHDVSPEELKARISKNLQTIKRSIAHYRDPNRKARYNPILDSSFSSVVTGPALSLLGTLFEISWTPFESESVEDIKRDFARAGVSGCQQVFENAAGS